MFEIDIVPIKCQNETKSSRGDSQLIDCLLRWHGFFESQAYHFPRDSRLKSRGGFRDRAGGW